MDKEEMEIRETQVMVELQMPVFLEIRAAPDKLEVPAVVAAAAVPDSHPPLPEDQEVPAERAARRAILEIREDLDLPVLG